MRQAASLALMSEMNMNGYSNRFQIWAEESAVLSAGQYEWSFGNGDTGNMGIIIPQRFRLYALTFEATGNVANETRVRAVLRGGKHRRPHVQLNKLVGTASRGKLTHVGLVFDTRAPL